MTEVEETETVEHPVDNDEKNLHDEGMGPDTDEETESETEETESDGE